MYGQFSHFITDFLFYSNSTVLVEELEEEHIASWNFMALDSNKNKVTFIPKEKCKTKI